MWVGLLSESSDRREKVAEIADIISEDLPHLGKIPKLELQAETCFNKVKEQLQELASLHEDDLFDEKQLDLIYEFTAMTILVGPNGPKRPKGWRRWVYEFKHLTWPSKVGVLAAAVTGLVGLVDLTEPIVSLALEQLTPSSGGSMPPPDPVPNPQSQSSG